LLYGRLHPPQALYLAAVFFFEIAEKNVQSLDKFMVSGKPVPTIGKAQIAVFGFRVAGKYRQMFALSGSVLAMLDCGTRSPQHPRSSTRKGTESLGKRVKSVGAIIHNREIRCGAPVQPRRIIGGGLVGFRKADRCCCSYPTTQRAAAKPTRSSTGMLDCSRPSCSKR
jgi:hypothetical protein